MKFIIKLIALLIAGAALVSLFIWLMQLATGNPKLNLGVG